MAQHEGNWLVHYHGNQVVHIAGNSLVHNGGNSTANVFAQLRSYISSARKQGNPTLSAIHAAMVNKPLELA